MQNQHWTPPYIYEGLYEDEDRALCVMGNTPDAPDFFQVPVAVQTALYRRLRALGTVEELTALMRGTRGFSRHPR